VSDPDAAARSSPPTARNREPILSVLAPRLPASGLVLEIAAGAGEHALFNAAALPHLRWQPTDPDDEALASIAAWRDHSGTENLAPPLRLDAADPDNWPVRVADAVVCINMIHISPWPATLGLVAGAARVLPSGGGLFTYGPYLEDDVETAPSNLAFDASLKSRNPDWGLRRVSAVAQAGQAHGLMLAERIAMPANNLMLVFRKA
jgi:hypothetical protein